MGEKGYSDKCRKTQKTTPEGITSQNEFQNLGEDTLQKTFHQNSYPQLNSINFSSRGDTECTREIKVSSANEVFTSAEKFLHSDTTRLHWFLVCYCLATKEKWAKLQIYRPQSRLTASVWLHSYAFVLTSLKIWQWSAMINHPIIVTFRN